METLSLLHESETAKKSAMDHLKPELTKFAETTSMKGVPRLMKCKVTGLRLLWLVSVMGFLCMSLYQCITLITEYMLSPQVISIKDINALDMDDYDEYRDTFAVPDVTVCNQNSLTSYKHYDGVSWEEYFATFEPVFSQADRMTRGRYLSPRGYIEYLGPKEVLRHRSKYKFILDCSFGYHFSRMRMPCEEYITMREYITSFYSQCQTVSLNKTLLYEVRGTLPTVITLTLYLDEVNAPEIRLLGIETAGTSGAVVAVHGEDQLPVWEDVHYAQAGALTTFRLGKVLHERFRDTKTPCMQPPRNQSKIRDLSGFVYDYGQQACVVTEL